MTRNKLQIAGVLLGLALIGFLAALLFPMLQGIGYALTVQAPSMWFFGIIGLGATGIAVYYERPMASSVLLGGTILLALIVAPFMSNVYAQEHVLENQEFEERAELPERYKWGEMQ